MADLEKEFEQEVDLDAQFDAEEDITFDPGEATMSTEQEEPQGMSEAEAALTTFDPLFLNPTAAGAGAALGQATAGVDDDQIDQVIAQTQDAAEKIRATGDIEKYGKLLEQVRELEAMKGEDATKAFYEGREAFKEQEDKAFEEHPGIATASTIASGFAAPVPGATLAKMGKAGTKMGKVAKAASKVLPNLDDIAKIQGLGKKAARAEKLGLTLSAKKLADAKRAATTAATVREGAKMGAMAGALKGDAKLLEGDVEGFITDTLGGGAIGGAGAYGFDALTRLGGAMLSNTQFAKRIKDSYSLGTTGRNVDRDYVMEEAENLATGLINDFKTRMKGKGKSIEKFYDEFSEAGYALNTKEDLEAIEEVISKMEPSNRKEYTPIVETLKDFLHGGKAHDKALEKLEKDILKKAVTSNPVEQAQLKLQKKALRDEIKNQFKTVSMDDMGELRAKDMLPPIPGEEADITAQAYHKIREKTTPEGVVQTHSFDAADTTPFRPSAIKRTVDKTTGREVTYYKDLASGKINAVIGDITQASSDPSSLSLSKAKELRDTIKRHIESKSMDGELKARLIDAKNNLQEKLVTAIKSETDQAKLKDLNKVYSSLKDISKITGMDKDFKVDALESMTQFVLGTQNKGDNVRMNEFIKRVKNVDPKLANKIMEEVTQLRSRYDISGVTAEARSNTGLVSDIANPTGFFNKVFGNLIKLTYEGANAVGRTQHRLTLPAKTMGKSLANRSLAITEASPQQLQWVIDKIQKGGNKTHQHFLRPLQKAVSSNQRTKQAVLYGLSQQQAFLDMVDSLSKEDEKTDVE